MTHLPDCDDYAFSGAGYHPNCERICICRQVRRIEKRLLDAAREALDALPTEQTVKEGVSEFWVEINHALAAIDALREEEK